MFGGTLLDVLIGVVFVYLFLSLIGTVATEIISNLLKMRSKNLEQWVRNVLEDPQGSPGKNLSALLYAHPLVKGLMQDGRKPSYIPTRTFSLALLDVIAPIDPQKGSRTLGELRDSINELPEELKKTMLVHLDAAQNDLNAVRENIEKWFDDSMERVAGWYKRKSQVIVLVMSFIITVGMNVDTISLATRLYNDSALRAALVASAEEIVKQPATAGENSGKKLEQVQAQLGKMQFPLGWSAGTESQPQPSHGPSWWITIIGWIITALAVSLGAPFWFDILGKIINVRSAGVKPQKTRDGE